MLQPEIVELDSSDSEDIEEVLLTNKNGEEIIDLEAEGGHTTHKVRNKIKNLMKKTVAYTPTFLEFVDLCIRCQDNKDMRDILKVLIIPKYEVAEEAYLNSDKFNKILKESMKYMRRTGNVSYEGINRVLNHLRANGRDKINDIIAIDDLCDDQINIVEEVTNLDPNEVIDLETDQKIRKEVKKKKKRKRLHNIEQSIEIEEMKETIKFNNTVLLNEVGKLDNKQKNNNTNTNLELHSILNLLEEANADTMESDSIAKSNNVEGLHDKGIKTKSNTVMESPINSSIHVNSLVKDVNKLQSSNICDEVLHDLSSKNNNINFVVNGNLTKKRKIQFNENFAKENEQNNNSLLQEKIQNDEIQNKISIIEMKIANCKSRIQELELSEVNLNDETSAYILVDKYKVQIVNLYKELCTLTDNTYNDNKRPTIRLEVPLGHPRGPAMRLEEWFNRPSIDDQSLFPDFMDVVKCVATANVEDCLGWSSKKVFTEARSLFKQCGMQLQKRRQKREWKHLQEMMEDVSDPADLNPELEAKLQKNKDAAEEKVTKIIEFYTTLETKERLQKYEKKYGDSNKVNNNNATIKKPTLKPVAIASETETDNNKTSVTPTTNEPELLSSQMEEAKQYSGDNYIEMQEANHDKQLSGGNYIETEETNHDKQLSGDNYIEMEEANQDQQLLGDNYIETEETNHDKQLSGDNYIEMEEANQDQQLLGDNYIETEETNHDKQLSGDNYIEMEESNCKTLITQGTGTILDINSPIKEENYETNTLENELIDNDDEYTDESEDSDIELIEESFVFIKDENDMLHVKKEIEVTEESLNTKEMKTEIKSEVLSEKDVLGFLFDIEQKSKNGLDIETSIIHEEPSVTIIFDSSDDSDFD